MVCVGDSCEIRIVEIYGFNRNNSQNYDTNKGLEPDRK